MVFFKKAASGADRDASDCLKIDRKGKCMAHFR